MPAMDIWERQGHLYYSQKLSFEHFIGELQSCVGSGWSECLIPYVKVVFFHAREQGVYPLWYELSSSHIGAIVERQQEDICRRHDQVDMSKVQFKEMMHRTHEAYDLALARRSKRREQLAEEHRAMEEYFAESTSRVLRVKLTEANMAFAEREQEVLIERQKADSEELSRLAQRSMKYY